MPEGERLDFGSGRFMELEGRGLAAAADAAFVLVAGGLGERLGYQGECILHVCTFLCQTCPYVKWLQTLFAVGAELYSSQTVQTSCVV